MDLWDLVKLMVRRWLVSVPLVLLTGAAVAWTAVTVQPHYTAEGSVLLLPPTVERPPQPGEPRDVNPWDTQAMTGAMVTLLRSSRLHAQLAAEGHEAVWEAGRDVQFYSMINVLVTAESERQAQEAVQRLTEIVTAEVAERQQRPELSPGETVTVVTLADGENTSVVRGNQMRALIVVLFAGGLLTMIGTIAADALLRARAARLAGKPPAVKGAAKVRTDSAGAEPAPEDLSDQHVSSDNGSTHTREHPAVAAHRS